jgi:hypothetical protein
MGLSKLSRAFIRALVQPKRIFHLRTMFRILLALFFVLQATAAFAINPGLYECAQVRQILNGEKSAPSTGQIPIPANHKVCQEIEDRLKTADQKVLIYSGSRTPDYVNPEWVSLSNARRAALPGLSLVIWVQTDRDSSAQLDPQAHIKMLNEQVHKVERKIKELNFGYVLILAPTLSDTRLGWYVVKDTKTSTATRNVHVKWSLF